jgi:hypothetical protein
MGGGEAREVDLGDGQGARHEAAEHRDVELPPVDELLDEGGAVRPSTRSMAASAPPRPRFVADPEAAVLLAG